MQFLLFIVSAGALPRALVIHVRLAAILKQKGWTGYRLAQETGRTGPTAYRLAAPAVQEVEAVGVRPDGDAVAVVMRIVIDRERFSVVDLDQASENPAHALVQLDGEAGYTSDLLEPLEPIPAEASS